MNTPKIRFKGFKDDWEQRKLGDSCKLNGRIGFRGYTEKDIVTKEIGGVLTFSPTNIVDNKLTMECKNTYITREKYDESPEIKIFNGDILFVKTGSTLGKSALVTGLKEDASINPQIVVMRVEKDKETFMSNVLITDGIKKQVTAVKIGGAVPTMTETELKNIKYYEPVEKEEQKRIGQYFEHLDHLITLHQRKCDETKQLKKFMLQKMFPKNGEKNPEIRFEGFTDAWEQRKVLDLLVQPVTDGPHETPRLVENGIPFISVDAIVDNKIDFSRKRGDVSEEYDAECCKKYKPQYHDVYVVKSGSTVGKVAIVETTDRFNIWSPLAALRCEGKTKPYYLFYLLQTRRMQAQILDKASNGTQPNLSMRELEKFDVLVTDNAEEQQRIGDYFKSLDHLITLHQRKCEKLKALKKFMLQNMFI